VIPDNVIRRIFNFASLGKKDIFYHLGCGDGNAVAIAAREFNVKRSIGIEIKKSAASTARKKIANVENAEIVNADIRRASMSEATIILFWFTQNDIVQHMLNRFNKELIDGCKVITIWAPLDLILPSKADFPFFICKKPFRQARSMRDQIKAIYGTPCVDFTASWLLTQKYIDALEVLPVQYRRFVNILQSMVVWINAWNMGVACEAEIPPPVETYLGILKNFFNIDLSSMILNRKTQKTKVAKKRHL